MLQMLAVPELASQGAVLLIRQRLRRSGLSLQRWLLLATSFFAVGAFATEPLQLVTKQWPGYTNADLSGGYFDLVRLVLPPAKYQINIQFSNFSRAVKLVQKEQADLVVAVTRSDSKQLLLSEFPIDVDTIVAVYRRDLMSGAIPELLSLAQLLKYRLAWDLAYNYGQALGLEVAGYEVANVRQGLELVSNGRVEVYLAEQSDLATPQAKVLLQYLQLQQTEIQQLPIYVGFSRSAKGLLLKRVWDQQFNLLLQQGAIQTFYQAHPEMDLATTLSN